MAITAAVATVAVAAGTTVYNISEQKKAANKQADQAKAQEAKQAALANEAKMKENNLMAQSFAASNRKRAQSGANLPGAAPAVSGSPSTSTTGVKTLIGS